MILWHSSVAICRVSMILQRGGGTRPKVVFLLNSFENLPPAGNHAEGLRAAGQLVQLFGKKSHFNAFELQFERT